MDWQLEPDNIYHGSDCTNCRTEQDRIQSNKEFTKLGREADRQREQDIKELFRIMSKWIEKWWD
jgi:hypothetical protein